jgi:hypothetical protein
MTEMERLLAWLELRCDSMRLEDICAGDVSQWNHYALGYRGALCDVISVVKEKLKRAA